jgi:hypothetical protein
MRRYTSDYYEPDPSAWRPTKKQLDCLARNGLPCGAGTDFWEAANTINKYVQARRTLPATPKQKAFLIQRGKWRDGMIRGEAHDRLSLGQGLFFPETSRPRSPRVRYFPQPGDGPIDPRPVILADEIPGACCTPPGECLAAAVGACLYAGAGIWPHAVLEGTLGLPFHAVKKGLRKTAASPGFGYLHGAGHGPRHAFPYPLPFTLRRRTPHPLRRLLLRRPAHPTRRPPTRTHARSWRLTRPGRRRWLTVPEPWG